VLIHPAFNEPHPALEPYYLQNVAGNPLETTITAERLICAGALSRHPGLRLILLHGGGYLPYQAGRLAHACGVRPEIAVTADDVRRAFGQLYFDTITHDVAALRFLAERVGVDHVLLGTDLPFDMAMRDPAGTLAGAFEDAAFTKVCSSNAARLFGLRPAAAGPAQAAPAPEGVNDKISNASNAVEPG
jgi:aminocarboxymuconate-semialdehyde decarboxylase